MIELVAELPPIVVSDLLGIAPGTAHQWARFAQDSWADYLAACQEDPRVLGGPTASWPCAPKGQLSMPLRPTRGALAGGTPTTRRQRCSDRAAGRLSVIYFASRVLRRLSVLGIVRLG
ncbi:hypothetical protein [Streptomyces sp. NPDC056491]|uniref:hypothetical protein n=1 Tax=Streptomyces sp. NPDC056491 TaxID=3345837 RepID=UPI00367CE0DA